MERDQEQLKMPCKMPYACTYILLLIFNGLLFAVIAMYDNLNYGKYTPTIPYENDPEMIRHRPYVIISYVVNSLATIIFLIYMFRPNPKITNNVEVKMVVRWFFHIIAFAFVVIVWIFHASQLWIYAICFNDSTRGSRIMNNDHWTQPIYSIMYVAVFIYGLFVAFPCLIYLMWMYFVKTEEMYKSNPQPVRYHKIFNKVCYFATYISIMTVMSVNLTFLEDYQTYFVYDLPARHNFPQLAWEMFLPVRYLEYIFTGLALLFAAFLFVKEIFDTMRSKKRHIRRQLLVLTSALFCITLLTVDRIVQVFRYDKIIKQTNFFGDQIFLKLYNDLRKVMWCYIFLLFPITIYSIRNLWIEWKHEFASDQISDSHASDYKKMDEQIQNERRGSKPQINEERLKKYQQPLTESDRNAYKANLEAQDTSERRLAEQ